MRTRNLMVGMLAAGLVNVFASAAVADRMELSVNVIKAGVPGVAEIKVDGPSKDGGYDEVATKMLDYYVSVRGDAPDKSASGYGWIHFGDSEVSVVVDDDWTKYKISSPFTDPWGGAVVNETISPAKLCNQKLAGKNGAARAAFLKKGESFIHDNAYAISGSTSYVIKKKLFDEVKKYTAAEMVPVRITCLALDRPRVRETTETKPAPKPSGQKMKPTISEVGLRIEPASVVQDGKYLCPTKLKLYGTVDTIRKFYGQALFVGPHYLSNITPLNFQDKGHRNVTGTYPINWSKKGGLTTTPNAAPTPQKLTFRFNVADKDGKVLESAEETVEVSCKKVKVNAPTASGDMTVAPTN